MRTSKKNIEQHYMVIQNGVVIAVGNIAKQCELACDLDGLSFADTKQELIAASGGLVKWKDFDEPADDFDPGQEGEPVAEPVEIGGLI